MISLALLSVQTGDRIGAIAGSNADRSRVGISSGLKRRGCASRSVLRPIIVVLDEAGSELKRNKLRMEIYRLDPARADFFRGLRESSSFVPEWHPCDNALGHCVVCLAVQETSSLGFMNTAPLLKEKRDRLTLTKLTDAFDPALFHRSGTLTTLAANDCPVDPRDIELPQIFQK